MTTTGIDSIDARLLQALIRDPRATAIALAEEVGASRNTVQARLAKWDRAGPFLAVDRRIDPAFLGYPLQAYVLVNLKQRLLSRVAGALREVPEVVEVHGLSGAADLLVQVVARDGDDLYRVAGRILDIKGVKRTKTSLVMRHLVDFRVGQLISTAPSDETWARPHPVHGVHRRR